MRNRAFFVVGALVVLSQVLSAQVNVTLNLRMPMPYQISVWEKDPTVIQVVMTTATIFPDVRVSFTIKNSGGTTVASSKDNDPSMPHFKLPVGTTTKMGPDLVSMNAVDIDQGIKTTTTSTNSLPEDTYDFCVKLIDNAGNEIPSIGVKCRSFTIIIPDPPTLINPSDQTVLPSNPQPTFTWTPVMIGGGQQPKYQLTIAPMFGSQSGRDAIEANTPLFQQTTPVTTYFYSVANPAFSLYPSAAGFAWQVQVQDQDGSPAARNDGKSEIFIFTLQAQGGGNGPLTLSPYYPANNDTIPWIPPHLIVKFDPYSDSISEMDFTLHVNGSDASSYTTSRKLLWPQGPRIGQGWPDSTYNDRSRYIIVDHEDQGGGVVPSAWTKTLKRGVQYTWTVDATFKKGGATSTVASSSQTFFVGAAPPHLVSPEDAAVIDTNGQPVTLTFMNLPPGSLNPPSLVGMGSSMLKTVFKGGAQETWRIQESRDQQFGKIDTSMTQTIPSSPSTDDSTWGFGADLFASHTFTLAKLDTGTYYWRAAWLDGGNPYFQGPVWSFRIDTTSNGQKKGPPPPSGACNDPCIASAPSDSQASSGSFSLSDVLQIGKFSITLTKLTSSTGSNLSGEGTIPVPFLKAPMRVSFTGLKVNKSKQVFSGNAEAIQDNSSPISQSIANQGGSALGLDTSQIRMIYNFASQAQRLVSALTGSTPTALPIGFDNVIDGDRMVIAIIGMTFTPTQAKLNALSMFQIADLGPGVGIGVGARDICFQPGGISTEQGTLYLGTDLGYRNTGSWGFVFKAPAMSDSGTFVEWDCNGFKGMRLEAQVEFPRDWLVPDPDDGTSLVKATFVARIRKAGDWLASANLAKCTIAGANGFGLSVTDMYYDHSDVQNPAGMKFPDSYNKSNTGPTWHGFYLKNATVTLPKGLQTFKSGPPQLTVSDMLIDGTGISADFMATNVIHYPEGDFGSWGASIDTIDVKLVSSSLQSAEMAGQIQIPISNAPLVYTALISRPKDQSKPLNFYFTITPKDSVTADLWAATLSLDKTSMIQLLDTNGSFLASASLDGHLWISGDVGNTISKIPGIHFKGIKFQGVKLMSKSPYADPGTWSLASEQHSMAGFPISLSNIAPVVDMQMSKIRLGLQFTLSINLHGDDTANGIAGSTTLAIWGAMPLGGGGGPQTFGFDEIELKSVTVHAQISALTIDGSLILYHHDATFGDGFRGALTVNFVKVLTGKATAQFGSVNGYRYWYVDAMITLVSGIPMGSSGVGLYGFAGGAWYHMTRNNPSVDLHGSANSSDPNSAPADSSTTPGGTNSGITFTPDVGVDLGLKAGVTLGTYPSPAMFNADVSLTVQFVNGGVGLIAFDGNGFFICPSIDSRKDALVFLTADIQYDFVQKSFDANFSFYTNDTYKVLFQATGWMNFHADPTNWHILIGTPNNRNKVTLLSLATVDSYLMAGTDIPAPDFDNFEHKSDIEAAIGGPLPSVHAPIAKGPTEGLAFGASMSLDTGRQTFLIFFGRFQLGYGFDIAFTRDMTRKCDNTGSVPGIDGWYAVGQLYAYINFQIGLHVDVWFTEGDFTILDMGAGARCIVMAPNPIWVQGTVGGHYNILGGLVSGQCTFTFEVGDKCVVSVENPLAAVDLITDMQPGDGASNVDVFTVPKVAFNLAIGQSVDIQYVDGDGNPVSKTFHAMLREFAIKRTDNGQPVAGHYEMAPDATSAGYLAQDALEEYTQYTVTATVYAEEYKSGIWVQTYKMNGDPVTQTRTATFGSGKRPDVILAQNVMQSYPLDRQKFFLQDESHNGQLAARASGYLFQEAGTYHARFIPLAAADTTETSASYDIGGQSVRFPVPALKGSTVYALQIFRRDPVSKFAAFASAALFAATSSQTSVNNFLSTRAYTQAGTFASVSATALIQKRVLPGGVVRPNEKLLYVYYFQTSKFNTLSAKLSGTTFKSLDYSRYWGIHEAVTAHFGVDEVLDTYDVNGYDVFDGFSTTHMDALVHVDAHMPTEYWYTSFVWPSIYDHIHQLSMAGIWDQPLSDHFSLIFGLFNAYPTAVYDGGSSGKLYVPSVDDKYSGSKSLLTTSFHMGSLLGGGLGFLGGFALATPEIKIKYLHSQEIGDDYFNLWWKCHSIMMEYGWAGYDDPWSWLYGLKDWVDNNGWWINYYASLDINGMTSAYQFMKDDYYVITFIYSPNFTWYQSGPWIAKKFTLGNPPKQLLLLQGFGHGH